MIDDFEIISKLRPSVSYGPVVVLQFDPSNRLCSPDIFSYLEDLLNVEIIEVLLIKDGHLRPTGLAFAQTFSKITDADLVKIKNVTFKGTPVEARMIESIEAYKKTIHTIADAKLMQIALPPTTSEGIVYIKNFGNIDINQKFASFGEIKSIDLIDTSCKFPVRAVHYSTSDSAFNAAKILNGKDGIIVGAIALRDARHNLFIRNLSSKKLNTVISKICEIGDIQMKSKIGKCLYVKMVNLFDAQIACALLTAEHIHTYFICDETADVYLC